MTKFIEDVTSLDGYAMFRPNVAVEEAKETQTLMNQGAEDLEVEATMPATTNQISPESVQEV